MRIHPWTTVVAAIRNHLAAVTTTLHPERTVRIQTHRLGGIPAAVYWVCLKRQTAVSSLTRPARRRFRTSSSRSISTSTLVAPLPIRPRLRTIPVRYKSHRGASQLRTTSQPLADALGSSLSPTIPAARPALLLRIGFSQAATPPDSPHLSHPRKAWRFQSLLMEISAAMLFSSACTTRRESSRGKLASHKAWSLSL